MRCPSAYRLRPFAPAGRPYRPVGTCRSARTGVAGPNEGRLPPEDDPQNGGPADSGKRAVLTGKTNYRLSPPMQPCVGMVPPVQVGFAKPPCEQVEPAALTPAVQYRNAEPPAVQSCDAVGPAVQSISEVVGELPFEQIPDPLAIAPNGTRTGDSYVDLPLAFCPDIWHLLLFGYYTVVSEDCQTEERESA
jgi:hypothetical protein